MRSGNLPSLKEEIDRKALETLQNLLSERQLGALSNREFSVGLSVIYDCLAGLVDKEIISYVEMAYINEAKAEE